MTPAEPDQVEGWLIALQVATAGGKRSEESVEAAFNLFSAALRQYPADVARDACQTLAVGKWFPTLGELTGACDRLAAPRRVMLQGLKAWRPKTERERLEQEADDWLHAAYQADHDKIALRVRDPDAASEAAEFSVIAWAKHREFATLARQA